MTEAKAIVMAWFATILITVLLMSSATEEASLWNLVVLILSVITGFIATVTTMMVYNIVREARIILHLNTGCQEIRCREKRYAYHMDWPTRWTEMVVKE